MNKYYAILGLPNSASKDEVRRAYRRLVLKWHPDKNPSPEAHSKFIAITEAYDILMGERPAPRVKTTYSGSTYSTYVKPQPKSRQEQEKEKRAHHHDILRKKFDDLRQAHFRSSDFLEKKQSYYVKVAMYFTLAGLALLTGLILPFTLLSPAAIIITFPAGLGVGLRWFWKGGRIKMRADMLYDTSAKLTIGDITEFFRTRSGHTYFFTELDGE